MEQSVQVQVLSGALNNSYRLRTILFISGFFIFTLIEKASPQEHGNSRAYALLLLQGPSFLPSSADLSV